MVPQDPSDNALWVAVVILFSVLIGAAAAGLSWLGGHHAPIAVLVGGAAFGGSVALGLKIKKALGFSAVRPTTQAECLSHRTCGRPSALARAECQPDDVQNQCRYS